MIWQNIEHMILEYLKDVSEILKNPFLFQAKLDDVVSFEQGDGRGGRGRGQRDSSLLENIRGKLLNAANEKVTPIVPCALFYFDTTIWEPSLQCELSLLTFTEDISFDFTWVGHELRLHFLTLLIIVTSVTTIPVANLRSLCLISRWHYYYQYNKDYHAEVLENLLTFLFLSLFIFLSPPFPVSLTLFALIPISLSLCIHLFH